MNVKFLLPNALEKREKTSTLKGLNSACLVVCKERKKTIQNAISLSCSEDRDAPPNLPTQLFNNTVDKLVSASLFADQCKAFLDMFNVLLCPLDI